MDNKFPIVTEYTTLNGVVALTAQYSDLFTIRKIMVLDDHGSESKGELDYQSDSDDEEEATEDSPSPQNIIWPDSSPSQHKPIFRFSGPMLGRIKPVSSALECFQFYLTNYIIEITVTTRHLVYYQGS